MSAPGATQLVDHGAARVSQSPVAQNTSIPVYTLLLNAGLSPADITSVGDQIWRRMKAKIARQALSDDVARRLRYTEGTGPHAALKQKRRGAAYRASVNKAVLAEVLLEMKFNRSELATMDQSLRLGLAPEERSGCRIAKTMGPKGPQNFEIIEEHDEGQPERTVVKDLDTGEHIIV